MVLVRQVLSMEQQVHCSLLHVRIGLIRMVSKIIHSIVNFIFIFEEKNCFLFFSAWTNDRSNLVMVGYTTSTNLQVRMPIGDLNSTLLQLIVHVRDLNDCMTEWNMHPISVISDINSIDNLITTIQSTFKNTENSSIITANPFIQILYDGNQNDVCQWLISFSRILNMMTNQYLQIAIASMLNHFSNIKLNLSLFEDHIPAVSISVSSLNERYSIVSKMID